MEDEERAGPPIEDGATAGPLIENEAEDLSLSDNEACPDREQIIQEQLQMQMPKPPSLLSHPEILEKIKLFTNDIFLDVDKTPPLGRPGNLMIFGENTVPIFAAKGKVIMAASEVGQGRVLVSSTETLTRGINNKRSKSLTASAKKLQANIKQWLLNTSLSQASVQQSEVNTDQSQCTKIDTLKKDQPEATSIEALKLKEIDDLAKVNKDACIVFGTDFDEVLRRYKEVTEFVEGGGGLLLAFRPWHWIEASSDAETCTHMEPNMVEFLGKLGIALGSEKVWGLAQGVDVTTNNPETAEEAFKTLASFHLGLALDCCCKEDFSKMPMHMDNIACILTELPDFARRHLGDKIKTLFTRCQSRIEDCVPSLRNQVKNVDDLGAIAMCNKLSLHGCGFQKMPGINIFPGNVIASSLQECVDVQITSQMRRAYATGYYVPAGVEMRINVVEVSGNAKQWKIRIGAHSDRLYKKPRLARWPEIVMIREIEGPQFKIQSPFGGLIYLISPQIESSIKIQMSNVVEAPHFDLSDNVSVEKWNIRRRAPGPWADIEGRYIRLTLPSNCLRAMSGKALTQVMTTWDEVAKGNHELRGTDVEQHRGEWIVSDVQISAGGLHSGYPIMGHLDLSRGRGFLLNYENLTTTGFWGPFHELGHNMQRPMWTFAGTGEVTCNIFALYACDVIAGIPVAENPKIFADKRFKATREYLNSDVTFAELENSAWIGISYYAHLITIFGWDSFKKTFRTYEALSMKERPKQNQKKIDTWLEIFSRQVNVNIAPVMRFWKMGASSHGEESVRDLPPFLPDDKFTESAPQRVDDLLKQYPNVIRKI